MMFMVSKSYALFLGACLLLNGIVAQPQDGGGGGGGGPPEGGGGPPPGGESASPCPDEGIFAGSEDYMSGSPIAMPMLGNIGCVDNPGNTTNERGDFIEIGKDIYGLFEAGFTSDQFPCDTTETAPGGLDTETAQSVINNVCGSTDFELLNVCGGHAYFHYHEKMGCLYEPDEGTQHSTRLGTALDGNGIYGMYVDGGVLPTDLDACGGRFGITPDSDGTEVYYYPMKSTPPFTLSCFGPIESLQECRDLYDSCGDDDVMDLATLDGTVSYDAWCPCFDGDGSNVGAASAAASDDSNSDASAAADQELQRSTNALRVAAVGFLVTFML